MFRARVESKPPLSNLHFGKGPQVSVAGEQSVPNVSRASKDVNGSVVFGRVLCICSLPLLGRARTSSTVGVRAGDRGDVNPPPRYLSSGKGNTVKSACCDDVTRDDEVPDL